MRENLMRKAFTRTAHLSVVLWLALPLIGEALLGEDGTEFLQRAHRARAVWNGFPGFRAEITVSDGAVIAQGNLLISPTGQLTIDVNQAPAWLEGKLKSFIEHRFSASDDYQAEIIQEATTHPLGTLLAIKGDSLMGSRYRILDDVIREVHRQPEGGRFTITVLDVHRNPQGKYLPRVYSVSFWDSAGNLVATTVELDEWTRVADWDLPLSITTVRTASSHQREVRQIRFTNHVLLESPVANSQAP
jgi:hypothetical protein